MRRYILGAVLAATTVAVAACGTSTTPGTPTTTTAPAPSAAKKAPHGVRGRITAEDGSVWTVTTAKSSTVTVTVTPQTLFGTKAAPSTAQAFPVGSQVLVAGTLNGSDITARRIATPAKAAPASSTPAPPTPAA